MEIFSRESVGIDMEEDEKLDYRTHLISQLDSMIDSGVPIYDITLANKKAIKVNYRDKIEELEKENKELKEELEPIKKLNIPVEILVAEFERLEDIEDRKVQIEYDLVFKKGVNHMKSKIEDKIKELQEEYEEYRGSQEWEIMDSYEEQIDLLKQLLEE